MSVRAESDAGGELLVAPTLALTERVDDATVPPVPVVADVIRISRLYVLFKKIGPSICNQLEKALNVNSTVTGVFSRYHGYRT